MPHSVSDDKGLTAFNKHLNTFSFADGYTVSQADAALAKGLKKVDEGKFPNVARWWRNVSSYSAAEQGKWPAAGTSVAGPAAGAGKKEEKKDDDFDLFGDDDDEFGEEYEKEVERRAAARAAEKAAKGKVVIAKSMVVIDVKPWEAETDLKALEKEIRGIEMEGLVWGKCELKDIAFGVKKIVIVAVIEDDKVSVDVLQEKIEAFDEFVQSTDIASFSKL